MESIHNNAFYHFLSYHFQRDCSYIGNKSGAFYFPYFPLQFRRTPIFPPDPRWPESLPCFCGLLAFPRVFFPPHIDIIYGLDSNFRLRHRICATVVIAVAVFCHHRHFHHIGALSLFSEPSHLAIVCWPETFAVRGERWLSLCWLCPYPGPRPLLHNQPFWRPRILGIVSAFWFISMSFPLPFCSPLFFFVGTLVRNLQFQARIQNRTGPYLHHANLSISVWQYFIAEKLRWVVWSHASINIQSTSPSRRITSL